MFQFENSYRFSIITALISSLSALFLIKLSFSNLLINYLFCLLIIIPCLLLGCIYTLKHLIVSIALIFIFLSVSLSFTTSSIILISFLVPSLYLSFLLNFNIGKESGKSYYGLSLTILFFNIILISVLTSIIVLFLSSFFMGHALLSDAVLNDIKMIATANFTQALQSLNFPPSQINELLYEFTKSGNFILIFSLASSLICFFNSLFLISLYVTMRLLALKKPYLRGRISWPHNLSLPLSAIGLFIIALIICLIPNLSNSVYFSAIAVVVSCYFGFFVTGLAQIHKITWGKPWQILVLVVVYALILTLFFSAIMSLIISIIGVISIVKNTNFYPKPL